MILKIKIISPIVKDVLRLIKTANTSVPSMTEPPRIANPIPNPRKKPPKTEINNLSSVMEVKGIK